MWECVLDVVVLLFERDFPKSCGLTYMRRGTASAREGIYNTRS